MPNTIRFLETLDRMAAPFEKYHLDIFGIGEDARAEIERQKRKKSRSVTDAKWKEIKNSTVIKDNSSNERSMKKQLHHSENKTRTFRSDGLSLSGNGAGINSKHSDLPQSVSLGPQGGRSTRVDAQKHRSGWRSKKPAKKRGGILGFFSWEDLEEDASPKKLTKKIGKSGSHSSQLEGSRSKTRKNKMSRSSGNRGAANFRQYDNINSQREAKLTGDPRILVDEPYAHDTKAEIERTLARSRNPAVPNLLIDEEEIANTLSEYSKSIKVDPANGFVRTAKPRRTTETENANQENLARGKEIYEQVEQQHRWGNQEDPEMVGSTTGYPPHGHQKNGTSNFEKDVHNTTSPSRPHKPYPPAIRAGAGPPTPRPRKPTKEPQSPTSKIALGISALRAAELDSSPNHTRSPQPPPTSRIHARNDDLTFAQEAEKVRQWELQKEREKEAKDFDEVKRIYGDGKGGEGDPSITKTCTGPLIPPKTLLSNPTQDQERGEQTDATTGNEKTRDPSTGGLKPHPPSSHPHFNPSPSSQTPKPKPPNSKTEKPRKLSQKWRKKKKEVDKQEALMSGANPDIQPKQPTDSNSDSDGSDITYNEGKQNNRGRKEWRG